MRIVELILDEEQEESGIEAISIVESPAIESDFVALKNEEVKLAEVDKDKRILLGALLIPDKPIYRYGAEGEYYIFFSKDTVCKASQMYLKNGYQNSTTLEHDKALSGLTLVESWIVEDEVQDKSRKYGLNVPVGTWMGAVKVNNEEIWKEYVKTNKVKGFSIEGYFADKMEAPKNENKKDLSVQGDQKILEENMAYLQEIEEQEAAYILSQVNAIIKKDKRTKTGGRTEMESFSDYPDSVSNNAKRGIELNKKVNNKCATQVGKIRAQQLADKKPISMQTIKRMFSYLSRAEEYYDPKDTEACGTISYLLWGGKSAKSWAESKIKANEKKKN
jgi:hypothetical protein